MPEQSYSACFEVPGADAAVSPLVCATAGTWIASMAASANSLNGSDFIMPSDSVTSPAQTKPVCLTIQNSEIGEALFLCRTASDLSDSGLAAFDRIALGAPAQHAAREVGDAGKARVLQHDRGLRRARARTAHGDDGTVARKLARASGELPERNQLRAVNAPERAVIFVGLAHVDDLNVGRVFLERVGLDLPDAREGKCQGRPAGLRGQRGVLLGTTAAKIRRHRDVDQFRMRQAEIVHVADEIGFPDLATEPRIEAALFGDARHREAAVIVRGIEQAGRRQRQDLAANRAVHHTRVTLLEIRAAAAADQQAIAGEGHAFIVEYIGDAAVRVAGRGAGLEIAGTERDAVAMRKITISVFGAARRGEPDGAAELPFQQPRPGDVVRMNVRLERGEEREAQLGDERGVPP